jgi:phosphatidylethanolamine-binding protein (PEBP) family uncharacterized protein
MKYLRQVLLPAVIAITCAALMFAQPPAGKGPGGPGGPGKGGKGGGGRGGGSAFSVSSPSFPDGGEVPLKHSFYGENKSPEFVFNWTAAAPATLQSYAIIFHDIENATAKGPEDTLHWSFYNIPGTAKGLAEGVPMGDQADGSKHGPGIRPGQYFGPGAGPGPFHHYVFEFYALDTKIDPAPATRADLWKALEGHVIGKAAYVGRFHNQPAQ